MVVDWTNILALDCEVACAAVELAVVVETVELDVDEPVITSLITIFKSIKDL